MAMLCSSVGLLHLSSLKLILRWPNSSCATTWQRPPLHRFLAQELMHRLQRPDENNESKHWKLSTANCMWRETMYSDKWDGIQSTLIHQQAWTAYIGINICWDQHHRGENNWIGPRKRRRHLLLTHDPAPAISTEKNRYAEICWIYSGHYCYFNY